MELPDVQALFHGEGEFVEIAAREPSFAGFFFEGDRLVTLTTDLSRGEDVERAVRRTSPFTGVLARSWEVDVRSAVYSFNQLASWRNRLLRVVFELPDVATLDLSESRNRVAIGLATGSGEAAVWAAVEGAGVPLEAVIVEVEGPVVLSADLRSRVRPLVGGLQTVSKGTSGEDPLHGPYVMGCSYGFNAVLTQTLDTVFITNSHCTRQQFKLDSITKPFYQRFYDSAPSEIGVELLDPPSLGSPPCGSKPCRNSDAAAILLTVDSVALGQIARTEWVGTWPDAGSIVIDDNNPAFDIIGKKTWIYEGLFVDKVGQETGWTTGDVDKTCFTSTPRIDGYDEFGHSNEFQVLCAYRARYMADFGDSGAPVFVRASPTSGLVYLAGLHHGQHSHWWMFQTDRGVFSTIQGIEWDLGPLQVTAQASQLSVSIGGPEEVRASEWCAWNAAATGGNQPYTRSWYGALTGSDPYVQGFVTQSAWLYVDVTSADAQQVTDSIWIEVDEGAPDCEAQQ